MIVQQLGYSVQRPTTRLVQADVKQHRKWVRYTYLNLKKAQTEGAVIVFEDEASFRQTPTLHATWARRGSQAQIPTRGERHTQKIFGAVRLDNARFIYIRRIAFSGRPIWLSWSKWSCRPSGDAATASAAFRTTPPITRSRKRTTGSKRTVVTWRSSHFRPTGQN